MDKNQHQQLLNSMEQLDRRLSSIIQLLEKIARNTQIKAD